MTSVHGGQGVVAKLLNYTGNTKNCMSPAVPEHVYNFMCICIFIYIYIISLYHMKWK